jgi:hypothetical protein
MIPVSISSDDAVILSAEILDPCTIKAELLWVDQQMFRKDLEFSGIGKLRLPDEALGHPSSCLMTDVTLKFTDSIQPETVPFDNSLPDFL